jgi:hypothetical protein
VGDRRAIVAQASGLGIHSFYPLSLEHRSLGSHGRVTDGPPSFT